MTIPLDNLSKLQSAIEAGTKLYSVFERITLGNAQPKLNYQHEPRVLTNQTIVRPSKNYTAEQLKKEWTDEINKDTQRFKQISQDSQEATLPYLIHKYGWRIGDPNRNKENEFAVAYCDAYRRTRIFEQNAEKFILLKGDLTGIQKYIYGNIQPNQTGGLRDIAKKLRGRSVIVSLLTDFLAGVILHELGLSTWHLLFAGGGHFNLLVPKKDGISETLEKLIEKIDAQMRERFGENLHLVIAHKEFEKKEIEDQPTTCFSEINRILEGQKLQVHRKYLHNHFFSEEKSTWEDIKKRRKQIEDWEIEIGERLPKRELLVEVVTVAPIFRANKLPEIVTFEMNLNSYSLLVPEDLKEAKAMLADEHGLVSAQVFSINQTDFLKHAEQFQSPKVGFGFRFLGKTLPLIFNEKKGREVPKTFEEIVNEGGDENKLLAALRLDVDDLGFVFNRGMNGASLGEILTLSREIQYFFSAHFDYLSAQKKADGFENDHDLYLIYSGGDDAFAVGKWDNVIHFAQKLREDFHEFTLQNPDVHFSAGIFMGNPHYPVGRFYRDAGKLQDIAKDSDRKNRVRIFNQTLGWEEFHSKIELGKTFAEALDPKMKNENNDLKKLPSAFAYRILNLVKSSFHERAYQERDGIWHNQGSINAERFARNVAGLHYLFARHGFDKKRAEENVGKIERELIWDFLRSFDFGDEGKIRSVRDYLVALNYAIFSNRAKANKKS